jgi:undecaprenyl-diphosphatase
VAFLAAVVTGFIVVKWLLGYIKSHKFTAFAVYRIALGAALLLWLPAGN